jgi:hypothetical protein
MGPPGQAADTENAPPAAENLIYLRDDLPPPGFTPEGAEIEADSPPALAPLATELECYKHRFSERGKYEIIGDRWILRKKNSQRVLGVLRVLRSLLNQDQRTALRQR